MYQFFIDEVCDRGKRTVANLLSKEDVQQLKELVGDTNDYDNAAYTEQLKHLIDNKNLKIFIACVRVVADEKHFFDVCDGFIAKSKLSLQKEFKKANYLYHDYGEISSDERGIIEVDLDTYIRRKKACADDYGYLYARHADKDMLDAYACVQNLKTATDEGRVIDNNIDDMDFTELYEKAFS